MKRGLNSKMKYCIIDKVSSNLNKDLHFLYLRYKKLSAHI